MKINWKLIILAGNFAAQVLAGNDVGHGVDTYHRDTNNAWFLGKENTIRVCSVVASNFGISASEADASLRNAFSTWQEYMEKKRLSWDLGTFSIASKVRFQNCDGTE